MKTAVITHRDKDFTILVDVFQTCFYGASLLGFKTAFKPVGIECIDEDQEIFSAEYLGVSYRLFRSKRELVIRTEKFEILCEYHVCRDAFGSIIRVFGEQVKFKFFDLDRVVLDAHNRVSPNAEIVILDKTKLPKDTSEIIVQLLHQEQKCPRALQTNRVKLELKDQMGAPYVKSQYWNWNGSVVTDFYRDTACAAFLIIRVDTEAYDIETAWEIANATPLYQLLEKFLF